ncbi:MAG: fimbria major subunit [Muribaculaceae bacterium]|nr:fimbria major subunit [Muribaculaceae bacterium]
MKRNLRTLIPVKRLGSKVAFATVACLGLGLFSCSSEGPVADEPDNIESAAQLGDISFQVDLSLPEGTRSVTNENGSSSGGTEYGTQNENKINTLNVYFCQGNKVVMNVIGLTGSQLIPANDGKSVKASWEMNSDGFATIVAGKKITLLFAANTDLSTLNTVDDAMLAYGSILRYDTEGKVVPLVNSTATGELNFEGLSAEEVKEELVKANYAVDMNSGISNIGGLGTVLLEHGVARIDFQSLGENYIYKIGDTGLYGRLQYMFPVNVAKKFYAFRHMAQVNASEGSLFGSEGGSPYNWVYDYDWSAKKTASYLGAESFLTPTGENFVSEIYPYECRASLYGDTPYNGNYFPWIYVSENTLPSPARMIQGLSTGVAFQVILTDENGNKLTKEQLKNASNLVVEEDGENLKIYDPKYGMTAIAGYHTDPYYYLTYYYWIRHNDNHDLTVQGPMEFSIVRNNIYKLCVKSFHLLPWPYDPDAKDEQPEPKVRTQDFVVDVKVNSWGYYKITDVI